MWRLNIFLIVFFAFWSGFSYYLAHKFFGHGSAARALRESWYLVAPFWAAWVFILGALLYALFAHKSFHLDPNRLTVRTRLLGTGWSRTFLRGNITCLRQYKDGGEEEDSFPSWGLYIEGRPSAKLLSRQPYKISRWLGRTLAHWAGVEFKDVPEWE